jgi:hypothetical protein
VVWTSFLRKRTNIFSSHELWKRLKREKRRVLRAFSSSESAPDHEENIKSNRDEKRPHPPSSAPLPRPTSTPPPSRATATALAAPPRGPHPRSQHRRSPPRPRLRPPGPSGARAGSVTGAQSPTRTRRAGFRCARGTVTRQAGLDPRDPAPAFPHLQ